MQSSMRAYLATVERSTCSLRAISAWGTPCLSSLLISCCLGIGIVNILSFPSPAGCNRRMSRCFATREYNRRGGPVPLSMRGHPADHVGNQLPTLRENAAEPVGKTLNINSRRWSRPYPGSPTMAAPRGSCTTAITESSTSASCTPPGSGSSACCHRPARSATPTTTPWPSPSTERTRPSSSGGASPSPI